MELRKCFPEILVKAFFPGFIYLAKPCNLKKIPKIVITILIMNLAITVHFHDVSLTRKIKTSRNLL